VWPDMKQNEWGRVISIGGVDAFFGKQNRLHGSTTKAGITGFTRSLAQEGGRYNITANCVVPGAFYTSRTEEWYPHLEQQYAVLQNRIPLGRIGEPDDLSPTIAFLATGAAGYITGQVLHVNGGLFPTVREPVEQEFAALSEMDLEEVLPY